MAERRKVGIPPNIDRVLRAGLDTGTAFPAHAWFNVVGTTVSLVDVHDVGWTDVNAVSTTIASCHIDEGGHFSVLYR